MALTGLAPSRRTAGDSREILFAQGASSGLPQTRRILIYGTKTSTGDATVDTVFGPVTDDAYAVQKGGKRSEWYRGYLTVVAIFPGAEIYGIAVTESGGTAASKTITFAAGAATATTTYDVYLIGQQTSFTVTTGDTAIVQAAACAAAINAADSGRWPATAAVGAPSNDHIVTVTTANKGPRNDHVLQGLRVLARKNITTTCVVSAISSGTTDDDFTAALAAAATKGQFYYQIFPCYSTTAPTSTDNLVGECILSITNGALPINGKQQQGFFGFVGTQAQLTTVATDADANNVRVKFAHAESNDFPPYMLAATLGAVQALEETKHPSASLTGYRTDANKGRKLPIPAPFLDADRPTATEIEADLANGGTPICFDVNGGAYLNRCITSYSEASAGVKDYRASEGHIPSAIDFAWETFANRHAEQKQPFVAGDPLAGQKPAAATMYPSTMVAIMSSVIDDLTSSNPLGRYTGPILAPDKIDVMKASLVSNKVAGGLTLAANLFAVEHYNVSETTIRETGPAY